VYDVRVEFHSFACGHPVFPISFIEETVLSYILCTFDTFLEDKLAINVWAYFWNLYPLSLVYVYFYANTIKLCNMI
jgi:hypothetical protein